MKMNQLFSSFLILCIGLISSNAYSQCLGMLDTPESCDETYLAPDTSFDLDIDGYTITFTSQQIGLVEVYVVPGPGLSIFSVDASPSPYDIAAVLPVGTDVSALPLSDFSSEPLFMLMYGFGFENAGPWGGGTTGYLGLMTDDGRFGFVNLMDVGVLECRPMDFHFIVPERGISEAVQPGATTGDCLSLIFEEAAIPTLGQWGLILISMLVLILGVVAIKSPSAKKSFN